MVEFGQKYESDATAIINSEHYPLIAVCRTKLKALQQKHQKTAEILRLQQRREISIERNMAIIRNKHGHAIQTNCKCNAKTRHHESAKATQ